MLVVLRMLLEYVGEEVFMRGVSMYLKKHLYANSISRDLWDAIGEAADSNVTDMMQTWVCEVCVRQCCFWTACRPFNAFV